MRVMEADDSLPRAKSDPVALLARQDLDPLSADELAARIAALEAEIVRTRDHAQRAVNHLATADQLFSR